MPPAICCLSHDDAAWLWGQGSSSCYKLHLDAAADRCVLAELADVSWTDWCLLSRCAIQHCLRHASFQVCSFSLRSFLFKQHTEERRTARSRKGGETVDFRWVETPWLSFDNFSPDELWSLASETVWTPHTKSDLNLLGEAARVHTRHRQDRTGCSGEGGLG